MEAKRQKHLSKFLSLVLRHCPEVIGIELDSAGWTSVPELLEKAARQGTRFSEEELRQIVAESDKQRFALSEDGSQIRANQGHSVAVELELEPQTPPEILFHGTVERFLASIRESGLVKGSRHHVHLSEERQTAEKVGSRRGKPIILEIQSGAMHTAGHNFFRSENGVWLTDHVPPEFLRFPGE